MIIIIGVVGLFEVMVVLIFGGLIWLLLEVVGFGGFE